jgi:hypothetical protein
MDGNSSERQPKDQTRDDKSVDSREGVMIHCSNHHGSHHQSAFPQGLKLIPDTHFPIGTTYLARITHIISSIDTRDP